MLGGYRFPRDQFAEAIRFSRAGGLRWFFYNPLARRGIGILGSRISPGFTSFQVAILEPFGVPVQMIPGFFVLVLSVSGTRTRRNCIEHEYHFIEYEYEYE